MQQGQLRHSLLGKDLLKLLNRTRPRAHPTNENTQWPQLLLHACFPTRGCFLKGGSEELQLSQEFIYRTDATGPGVCVWTHPPAFWDFPWFQSELKATSGPDRPRQNMRKVKTPSHQLMVFSACSASCSSARVHGDWKHQDTGSNADNWCRPVERACMNTGKAVGEAAETQTTYSHRKYLHKPAPREMSGWMKS